MGAASPRGLSSAREWVRLEPGGHIHATCPVQTGSTGLCPVGRRVGPVSLHLLVFHKSHNARPVSGRATLFNIDNSHKPVAGFWQLWTGLCCPGLGRGGGWLEKTSLFLSPEPLHFKRRYFGRMQNTLNPG